MQIKGEYTLQVLAYIELILFYYLLNTFSYYYRFWYRDVFQILNPILFVKKTTQKHLFDEYF